MKAPATLPDRWSGRQLLEGSLWPPPSRRLHCAAGKETPVRGNAGPAPAGKLPRRQIEAELLAVGSFSWFVVGASLSAVHSNVVGQNWEYRAGIVTFRHLHRYKGNTQFAVRRRPLRERGVFRFFRWATPARGRCRDARNLM